MNNNYNEYNNDVDYSSLKKHRYRDQPGVIFYTCPRCGHEYIASLFENEGGQAVCFECANE